LTVDDWRLQSLILRDFFDVTTEISQDFQRQISQWCHGSLDCLSWIADSYRQAQVFSRRFPGGLLGLDEILLSVSVLGKSIEVIN
jgi:hypothetical protein